MKAVLHFDILKARFEEDGLYYSVLAALPTAACAYLIALFLEKPSGQVSLFDLMTYTGVIALFAALWTLHLTRKLSTRSTLYGVLGVVCCHLLGKLVFLLFFNPHADLIQAELTETFFWMPTVYILGLFVPGLKWGRAVALGFFALSTGVIASYVVPNVWLGENWGVVYALVELALANATLFGVMQVFMGFKEASARESSRLETLHRLAYTDALTGLPNRLALEGALASTLEPPFAGSAGGVAVFFIDVDGFKSVNDSLGHEAGDALLKTVAARLQEAVGCSGLVHRISGDEFVVVYPDLPRSGRADALNTRADVYKEGERFRAALEQPVVLERHLISVSASIGIAVCHDVLSEGVTPKDLLRRADAAMYEVKKNGKNGVRHFRSADGSGLKDRAALAQELRRAVLGGASGGASGLSLFYQPVVASTTGRVVKVEALLRWQNEARGWVSPGEFIPIAEEVGLIHPLGTWALRRACQQARLWYEGGFTELKVCVNVSAHQFMQPDFAEVVAGALREAGLPPGCLELELTESVVVHAFGRVQACLQKLRAYGVAVSLDDFGTGYSSLAYLEALDFDTIKLDRSFAQKLTGAHDPQVPIAVVRAVVDIAAALGVQVVVEGVETQEQRDTFCSLGCTLMQGFLFARPMPAPQVDAYLLVPPPSAGGALTSESESCLR